MLAGHEGWQRNRIIMFYTLVRFQRIQKLCRPRLLPHQLRAEDSSDDLRSEFSVDVENQPLGGDEDLPSNLHANTESAIWCHVKARTESASRQQQKTVVVKRCSSWVAATTTTTTTRSSTRSSVAAWFSKYRAGLEKVVKPLHKGKAYYIKATRTICHQLSCPCTKFARKRLELRIRQLTRGREHKNSLMTDLHAQVNVVLVSMTSHDMKAWQNGVMVSSLFIVVLLWSLVYRLKNLC